MLLLITGPVTAQSWAHQQEGLEICAAWSFVLPFWEQGSVSQREEPTGKKSWQGVLWVMLGGSDALSL